MRSDGVDDLAVPFAAVPWPALVVDGGTVVGANTSARELLSSDPCGQAVLDVVPDGVVRLESPLPDGRVLVGLRDDREVRLLSGVVDAVADSTFTLDAGAALRWRSAGLVARAGDLPPDIAERNPVERIHPEDMPVVLDAFSTLLASPDERTRLEVRSRSVTDDDVFELIELVGTNRLDDPAVAGIIVQVRNLGEGRRVLDLAREDGDLHSLADAVPVGVLLGDPSGRVVYRNAAAKAIIGDGVLTLASEGWLELIRPEHRDELRELLDSARSGGRGGEMTVAAYRVAAGAPDVLGTSWLRLRLAPLLGTDGGPAGVIATIEDVTDQVEARAETERLTQMLDASSDFVVVWRPPTGETLWANAVTREMLDVPLADGSRRRLTHLLEADARDRFVAEATAILATSDVWHGELTLLHPRRGAVPVSATGVVQRADDGTIDTVALVARDISDLKAAEARLRHLANHDPLTGLPNRSLLTDHLDDAIARHRRGRDGLAVIFCDLDGFKEINDRLGHGVGDVVLTEIARRLGTATRDVDVIARVGGDEFVVVCEDVSTDVIAEIAGRLVAAVSPPILAGGETIRLSCSAGVAVVARGDEADADRLLVVADRAMYEAKGAGRDRFHVEVVGARQPSV